MTVKVGDVLEVDQFLSDDPTQIVAEVCGNVMFLRAKFWSGGTAVTPFTIDPWPAKFLKPKPPESPDDVVYEWTDDHVKLSIHRNGTYRMLGAEVDEKSLSLISLEFARLILNGRLKP